MDSYIGKSLTEAEFQWNYPAQEEWELLAEFEGILLSLQKYSMSLQLSDPALNSASLLESYMSLFAMNELSCNVIAYISLKASDYGSNNNLWSGSIMIMKLESLSS